MVPQTDDHENYFMDSELFQTMVEQVTVLHHGRSDNTERDFIQFEARDAGQVVELAGHMFPYEDKENQNVVQFSCDFLHVPGTDKVLGVCGIDDFNHRFWLTTCISCHTENGPMAEKIILREVDLINKDIRARKPWLMAQML